MPRPARHLSPVPSRGAATPRAVALLDGFHRVVRHNEAFARLFDRQGSVVGRSFGELLTCINLVVEDSACGLTTRCPRCILARALRATIQADERVGPVILHRTTFAGGAIDERAFRFETRPRRVRGEMLAVLSLRELGPDEARRSA